MEDLYLYASHDTVTANECRSTYHKWFAPHDCFRRSHVQRVQLFSSRRARASFRVETSGFQTIEIVQHNQCVADACSDKRCTRRETTDDAGQELDVDVSALNVTSLLFGSFYAASDYIQRAHMKFATFAWIFAYLSCKKMQENDHPNG